MEDDGPGYLNRGDVVLATDPFKDDENAKRPWLIANDDDHPFHGEQYVAMALTTRTWYDDRLPLTREDYVEGEPPEDSSIVPHSVTSLQHELVTDHVCRVRSGKVDGAVDELVKYLY